MEVAIPEEIGFAPMAGLHLNLASTHMDIITDYVLISESLIGNIM